MLADVRWYRAAPRGEGKFAPSPVRADLAHKNHGSLRSEVTNDEVDRCGQLNDLLEMFSGRPSQMLAAGRQQGTLPFEAKLRSHASSVGCSVGCLEALDGFGN